MKIYENKTEMFLSFSCDTLVSMTSYIALYPGGGYSILETYATKMEILSQIQLA